MLAILVALNYLASRHNKRWDLTAAQAVHALGSDPQVLDGPAEAGAPSRCSRDANDFQRFRDRLDEYQYVTKQVKVEYIDADKSPSRANQAGVQQLGTVVFDYDGRTERVTSDAEQDV